MSSTLSTAALPPWPYTLSEKLLFGFLYIISFSILSLPRKWQMKLGNLLGEFIYKMAGYRETVVLNNLKIAFPEMSDDERYKMMRDHFRHLGNLTLEYLWSPAMTQKHLKKWTSFEGAEHYDAALKLGKGAIILGSHMGSGDLGINICAMNGYPMSLVGKRTRIPWVTRMLFGLREIHGVLALPEERVAMDIFRALKKNRLVIFVLDQFMGPPKGSETFFFGHETGTTTSLGVFAERTGVPVIPVWTYRDKEGIIHVVIEPHMILENMDPLQMTQKYNDKLESFARQEPVQWFWVHQRWKKFVRH